MAKANIAIRKVVTVLDAQGIPALEFTQEGDGEAIVRLLHDAGDPTRLGRRTVGIEDVREAMLELRRSDPPTIPEPTE